MRRMFLLIGVLFIFSVSAKETWSNQNENGFAAHITLSSDRLSLFDNLNITITLEYPEGYHPNFDAIRSHLINASGVGALPFLLVSESLEKPQKLPGQRFSQSLSLRLEPQFPGAHTLAFYEIPFLAENKPPVTLISDLFTIDVTTPKQPLIFYGILAPLLSFNPKLPIAMNPENRWHLLENPTLLRETKENNIHELERKTLPLFAISGAVLVSGLILFSLYLFKKPKKVTLVHITPKDAKTKALHALEQLKMQYLSEQKNPPKVYAALTYVLRTFVEEKYHIAMTTHTTEELVETLKKTKPFPSKSLTELLLQADQVKFAHHIPSVDECLQTQEEAMSFIQNH